MSDASSNDTDSWQSLGTHTFRQYSNDTVIFRAQGDVTIEDVRFFVKFMLSLPRPDKGFFYLSNISHLRHQTQQVLNEYKNLPPNLLRAISVVGATFAHRVLLDAASRAARLLKLSIIESPTRFLATEEEGLAWFERIRRGEE